MMVVGFQALLLVWVLERSLMLRLEVCCWGYKWLPQSQDSQRKTLLLKIQVEDIGDMTSLTTLVVRDTAVSQVPSYMGQLKNLNFSSVQGLVRLKQRFPEVPKNYFPAQDYTSNMESSCVHNLPELSGLPHLERPCFNNCRNLLESGDLPTRLKELESDQCTALEIIPNFSEVSRQSILQRQGWSASGGGVICLPANDFPGRFAYVTDSDRVFFQVPQIICCNLKAFTVSVVCSPCFNQDISPSGISILVTNHTKDIWFTFQPTHLTEITSHEVIWQVNLLNNEFNLEGDDFVEVAAVTGSGFRVKKTRVNLVWDPKLINENTIECESIPYEYLTNDADKR